MSGIADQVNTYPLSCSVMGVFVIALKLLDLRSYINVMFQRYPLVLFKQKQKTRSNPQLLIL